MWYVSGLWPFIANKISTKLCVAVQAVTDEQSQQPLLCVAYVFEVLTAERGPRHQVYRLVGDWQSCRDVTASTGCHVTISRHCRRRCSVTERRDAKLRSVASVILYRSMGVNHGGQGDMSPQNLEWRDDNANCLPNFVMFENFKHQIACTTVQ